MTHNLPNFTSWQTCLDDPNVDIADVNLSLHWLSRAELSEDDIDKKQRLLYRKTQFRDQLSHHDPSVTDNFCQICKKHRQINKKETAKHALCSFLALKTYITTLQKS